MIIAVKACAVDEKPIEVVCHPGAKIAAAGPKFVAALSMTHPALSVRLKNVTHEVDPWDDHDRMRKMLPKTRAERESNRWVHRPLDLSRAVIEITKMIIVGAAVGLWVAVCAANQCHVAQQRRNSPYIQSKSPDRQKLQMRVIVSDTNPWVVDVWTRTQHPESNVSKQAAPRSSRPQTQAIGIHDHEVNHWAVAV